MGFQTITTVFVIFCLTCPVVSSNKIVGEWEKTNAIPDSHLRIAKPARGTIHTFPKHLLDSIKFWHYEGHGEYDTAEALPYNSAEGPTMKLHKDRSYKILIPGYLASGTEFEHEIATAYREKTNAIRLKKILNSRFKEVNVISVDWAVVKGNWIQMDRNDQYDSVVQLIVPIGEKVAGFLLNLKNNGFIQNMEDVHCIGHGLGAHICGTVGKSIQEKTGDSVGRITGLDPTGPSITPEIHLRKEHGKFVDVIHTDYNTSYVELTKWADSFKGLKALGTDKNCGHVDFYPNGGSDRYLTVLSINHPCYTKRIGVDHLCLHNYAYKAYSLSISNSQEPMLGYKCSNYMKYISPLGYLCSTSATFGEFITANIQMTKPGQYFLRIDKSGKCY